ncbi:MAG: hypothetical protein AB1921_02945 [Thermodesulfobacteriota bacterium]
MSVRRLIVPLLLAAFFFTGAAWAGPGDYPGWEPGGAYDKNYRVSEFDSFKGTIASVVEITPLPGMAPGLGILVVERGSDEKTLVHLGPKGFFNEKTLGLNKGDAVKVKGVWAEIGGKDIFMASKVKRSEYDEVKVRRSRDGYPFWAMTAEELKKEQEEK